MDVREAASVRPAKRKRQLVVCGNDERPQESFLSSFACTAAASCDELPRVQAAALRLALGAMVQPRLGLSSPGAVLSLDLVASVAERVQSRSVVVRSVKQLRAAIADRQAYTVELDPDLPSEFSRHQGLDVEALYKRATHCIYEQSLVITRPLRLVSGPGDVAIIPLRVKIYTENASTIETEDESLLALWRGGETVSIQHRCRVGEVVLANIHANVNRGMRVVHAVKVRGQDGSEVFFKINGHTSLQKLMDVYAQRQGGTRSAYRFIFDGDRIPSHHDEYIPTPDDLEMENGDVIDAMLEQVDIGVFEYCTNEVPGRNILVGTTLDSALPDVAAISAIARRLGGRPHSRPHYFSVEGTELLSHVARCRLMRVLDAEAYKRADQTDVKVDLSREQLEQIVGVDTVNQLAALFAEPFNDIKLRRTASRDDRAAGDGQCIAFHLDHAERTMQVPLNDPSDYDGGDLVFAMTNGQLQRFPRIPGTATVHDNGVVHGVSELRRGVRYALFMLRVPAWGRG